MTDGMTLLGIQGARIDAVLSDRGRNAPADSLLDLYTMLHTDDEREAFVAAVTHRLLVERAKRQHGR